MSRNPLVPRATSMVRDVLNSLVSSHDDRTMEELAATRNVEALRPAVERAYAAVSEVSLWLFHDGLAAASRQVHPAFTADSTHSRAIDGQQRTRADLVGMLVGNQMRVLGDVMDHSRQAPPRVAARRLRNALGLTGPLADSVQAYERVLAQPDRRTGEVIGPSQVDLMTGAMARNLRRQREEVLGLGEAQRAWGRALHEAWTQGSERGLAHGVTRQWVAGQGSRDSHVALHGMVRDLRHPFESGKGSLLMYPGDGAAPATEVVNCDCHLEYASV